MPNFKISQLEKVTNMYPDSFVLVVQNGKNYRMSIKEAINAYVDLSPYYTKEETEEALNIVDTRIDTLEGLATFRTIPVSYLDLRRLRDNGDLVPGQQYRITDYTCTTTQDGTKSAGHVFDIIVTADDENTLNEVAIAAKHEGDTYFANCDLNAWKICYSLDNDTNRFAWADATETDGKPNGKGVIYRMIDEFNNDVPYDFKNIQFYRKWDADKLLWSVTPSNNKGVPCYTFSSTGNESTTTFTDYSLTSSNNVYFNIIKAYINSFNKRTLNNNCFFGSDCYSNVFENNCYNNTFGESCCYIYFGNDCHLNIFGNNCHSNTFGKTCYYNIFGSNCRLNTFGNNCKSNTFGDNCQVNLFGDNCSSNTLGYKCNSNKFGNTCERNSLLELCEYNSIGIYCRNIKLGDRCCTNSIGNYCNDIYFASNTSASPRYSSYRQNHFGDGCQYILFKGAAETVTSDVQNYNFAQGLQGTSNEYLTIDGVRGRAFETKVAKKSNGELKIYCEADLIL